MYDLGYLQEIDHADLPTVFENIVPSLQEPRIRPRAQVLGAMAGRHDRDLGRHREGAGDQIGQRPLRPEIQGQGDDAGTKCAKRRAAGDAGRRGRPRSRRPTRTGWTRSTRSRQAADSGQIRRFTGNDYTEDLTAGNIVAAIGWSGDASIDRKPERRMADADRGLHAVVGQHGDPGRAPPTPLRRSAGWTSSTEPEVAADMTEYITTSRRCDGRQGAARETRPGAGERPAGLPQPTSSPATAPTRTRRRTSNRVNEAWQDVITG